MTRPSRISPFAAARTAPPPVDPLLALTTMTTTGCLPCQLAQEQGVGQYAPQVRSTPSPSPSPGAAPAAAVSSAALAASPPAPAASPTVAAVPVQTAASAQWEGVLGMEGELTGDGRLIEPGALRWDAADLGKLRFVSEDVGLHDGAVVVGNITGIERRPGGIIWGSGTFDLGSPLGREAARQVDQGLTNGISLDLDDVSFEIRVAAELMQDESGMIMGIPFFAADSGSEPPAEPLDDLFPAPDADGRITVAEINSDDEVRVTVSGRVRSATQVAIPAFASAKIKLTEAGTLALAGSPGQTFAADGSISVGDQVSWDVNGVTATGAVTAVSDDGATATVQPDDAGDGDTVDIAVADLTKVEAPPALSLAAGGRLAPVIPLRPPRSWFTDPGLSEVTALVVTPDGRVYGHIAGWNMCHTTHTQLGKCVLAPHSVSGYAYFRTGALLTQDGSEVAVGHLTLDTTHAGEEVSALAAAAHYENTGSVAADVNVGEDAHGIWVAGAVRPTVTEGQLRSLRSAPISGDWRRIGSGLELVAALAVNVPGFPVPRPAGLVASGRVVTLVASGMVPPTRVIPPSATAAFLTLDDLRYLKRLAGQARAAHRTETLAAAEQSAVKVRAFALSRRVSRARAAHPSHNGNNVQV